MSHFSFSKVIRLAALLIAVSLSTAPVLAQDAMKDIAGAVEALRVAMVSGDGAALNKLTHPKLVYGHSNARLENQAAFVASLDKKNSFQTLKFSDHMIELIGDVAVARHTFDAVINLPDGKTGTAHIHILQAWIKDGGSWKLLARQAAPLPPKP